MPGADSDPISWQRRMRANLRGPMLLQVLAIVLILVVAVEFASSYPAGLLPWRFWASLAGMGLLLALNVILTVIARKEQTSPWDWPVLATAAALVLFVTWASAQSSYVYVLSIVCGQLTFRRGVWPSGAAFGTVSILAWLALQVELRFSFYATFNGTLALAVGVAFVIALSNLLERLRRASRELEKAQARNTELAVAEERLRLARDLHDSVTQELYGVMLYSEAAADRLSSGETETATSHLRDLRDAARQALREMRMLVFDLHRPALAAGGLADALRLRLEAVEKRSSVDVRLQVDADLRLTTPVEQELFNIAQEALNNAIRHAHARAVHVSVARADADVVMEINDDGVGFSNRVDGGLGIPGMRERARRIGSTLVIESEPGKGTRVAVRIPITVAERKTDPAG